MANVPEYQTAYEKDGKPICPECGFDFTGLKRDNVHAHSRSHWEDIPKVEAYEEAQKRQAILEKIGKELGD